MTSLTSFEFDDQFPRFTLMLELSPWKEFLRSIPQSPYAFDFFEPPRVATSFTRVSSFSSLSLLKIWKWLLSFPNSSWMWLASFLTVRQFSSLFLRAVLIWETSQTNALSYLTPCSFIISATLWQISALRVCSSWREGASAFSELSSDWRQYSSLLSLPKVVRFELVLALMAEQSGTSQISRASSGSFFRSRLLSSLVNMPVWNSRLVLQFLVDSVQQLSGALRWGGGRGMSGQGGVRVDFWQPREFIVLNINCQL